MVNSWTSVAKTIGLGPYSVYGLHLDSGSLPKLGTVIVALRDVKSKLSGYNGCSAGTELIVTASGQKGVIARRRGEVVIGAGGLPGPSDNLPVILMNDDFELISDFPSTGIFADDWSSKH